MKQEFQRIWGKKIGKSGGEEGLIILDFGGHWGVEHVGISVVGMDIFLESPNLSRG